LYHGFSLDVQQEELKASLSRGRCKRLQTLCEPIPKSATGSKCVSIEILRIFFYKHLGDDERPFTMEKSLRTDVTPLRGRPRTGYNIDNQSIALSRS
jgi:hypothetical protein